MGKGLGQGAGGWGIGAWGWGLDSFLDGLMGLDRNKNLEILKILEIFEIFKNFRNLDLGFPLATKGFVRYLGFLKVPCGSLGLGFIKFTRVLKVRVS